MADEKVCLCFGPPVDDCPIHGTVITVKSPDPDWLEKLRIDTELLREAMKRAEYREQYGSRKGETDGTNPRK